ncbi:MAG: EF-hand domain-containing protein [Anaerolineae bacterium]|nr:EF-hand domain-containing protein [Anaerolineae bacterium]
MLSDILQKKLTRHFHFLDLDKDGYVERSDWVQCAQNLIAIREWQVGSPEYEAVMARHEDMWFTFWEPADLNHDGKVTLNEYLHLAETQRKMGFTYEMKQVRKLFSAIFDTVDLDGDGEISLIEYRQFFRAWGLDAETAVVAFASLDLNADARLSREAFLQYGVNFYVNDEPNVAGNMIFGSYE